LSEAAKKERGRTREEVGDEVQVKAEANLNLQMEIRYFKVRD
jgi:hypothetical protein